MIVGSARGPGACEGGGVVMWVYSSLLLGVLVGGAPFWIIRMATRGRYRAGLGGRLGRVPAGLRDAVRGRAVVWVHAVSVGEVIAAERMVRELWQGLEERSGELGWVVVVSTTTEAGQRVARERFGEERVFYMPLDLGFTVRRYLRVLRPKMLVLMESELWPRLLVECGRSGVPVAVVNARVSDRSFPRYMRLRRWWRPLLWRVSLFLAQGEETARRLIEMGALPGRVRVTGNLKYDVGRGGERAMVERVRGALAPGAKVVVCGSTLEGEEMLLLEAWKEVRRRVPEAVMVLAPRHTDRFERVAAMVGERGVRATRMAEGERLAAGAVVVLDTIGDLAAMYGLATVALVGGSLVEAGGHNPLEPARFGVPVVIGSSFHNFREVVETMQATNGIRVVQREQVAEVLGELLGDEAEARALGERGKAVFETQAGGTGRTVTALLGLLHDTAERAVAKAR